MLVISLEEVIATAEESIDTGTEALVDGFVVLTGSTADLTPLFLHSLDLLDSLVEGRVRGERSGREQFFHLQTEALLTLEILFFGSLTLVVELLMTLMLSRSQLLEFGVDLLTMLLRYRAKFVPLCGELLQTAISSDRILHTIELTELCEDSLLCLQILLEVDLAQVIIDSLEIIELITQLVEAAVEHGGILGIQLPQGIPLITDSSEGRVKAPKFGAFLIALEEILEALKEGLLLDLILSIELL